MGRKAERNGVRLGVTLAALGLIAACASSSGTTSTLAPSTTSSAPTTTTSQPITTTTTTTTAPPETTTSTTVDGGTEGELFVDPEGSYEIVVSPDWPDNHGSIMPGIELWAVGDVSGEFVSNLNVLTEPVDPEMTLGEYLQLSIDNGPTLIPDFTVVEQSIVTGTAGNPLGLLDYQGTVGGNLLRFFAAFAAGDGQMVVATLTALPDEFDALRQEVEPHLLTLQALETPGS